MARFLVKLAAVAALGISAYAWRHQVDVVAQKLLPGAVHGPLSHAYTTYLGPVLDGAVNAFAPVLSPQKVAALASPEQKTVPPSAGKGGEAAKRDGAQGGKQSGAAPKGKGGGGAAPVTATVAQLADMPVILSSPGTVEAMATVQIKPRVDGQVVEVGFKEGDLVTAGTTLYRLDDRLARAQIKQAEAVIAQDRASLKDAESILDRREALLRNKYASEAQTETARQQVEVLKAKIAAGLATLEAQKTQLDYLTIRAPITGRTGSINAKLGSFVRSADPTPLLTINQTKPIAVSFALPQFNLDALKQAVNTKAVAVITVPGTRPQTVKGTLFFVDNQVDKTTGTLTGKVVVENPDEVLWPGQAVGVALTVEVQKSLVAVIASGVQPAQQGMIAWVIAPDNTVSIRTVKQERVVDQIAYVSEGLKPGERVVIDGQLRLAPGGRVNVQDTRATVPVKPETEDGPPPAPRAEPDKSGTHEAPPRPPAATEVIEPRRNKRG